MLFAPPAQGRYCPVLVGFAERITQGAMDRGELREKRTRYKNMFWSFYHISWLHSPDQLFLILHVSHLCVLRSTSCCGELLLQFSDHALRRCSDGRVHANPGVFMIILLAVVHSANINFNHVRCHKCVVPCFCQCSSDYHFYTDFAVLLYFKREV